MTIAAPVHARYLLHGLAVSIRSALPAMSPALDRALGEFAVPSFPEGFTPITGTIRTYDKTEVMRHLSSNAIAISSGRDGLELYQDNERFWLIDDRWGLCELNLLKGQWRAWVLPECAFDIDRAIEFAVIWPIAQLLRAKGLYLLPAASVSRGPGGLLLIAPFSIEPELVSLIRSGFRVIGQRWTALREENGRIAMLHLPGRVERMPSPRLRALGSPGDAGWVDLDAEYCGSSAARGFVESVVLIEPARRPTAHLRLISASGALPALRRAWPIAELHPHRVQGQLPVKLSKRCKVYAARLSPRPQDLFDLLEASRRQAHIEQHESNAIALTTKLISRQLQGAPESLAV